jgi:hypothetical protein
MTPIIIYLAGVLCMTFALQAWKPEIHWWRALVVSILWPATAPVIILSEALYD